MPPLQRPGPRDIAILVALSAVWGSSFAAIEVAVASVPPLTVAAARIALAALVLRVWTLFQDRRVHSTDRSRHLGARGRGEELRLFAIAFFGSALPFCLIGHAEQTLPGSVAGILVATSPLLALGLSHAFTRDDRFTLRKGAGVLLGGAGVLVALGPIAARQAQGAPLLAGAAVVLAAGCYATAGLVTRTVQGLSPDVITARALLRAALLLVPASLAVDAPWRLLPTMEAVWALVWLGLFPTALAYLIRFRQIVAFGYTFVSFAGYLVPVFAVALGALLLDEPLRPSTLAALALILAGVVVSRGIAGRRNVSRRRAG